MTVNSSSPQEIMQKLEGIEKTKNELLIVEIIEDLENEAFFTASNPDLVKAQLNVRRKIEAILSDMEDEIIDPKITQRLEKLRDSLTAEETVAEKYAPSEPIADEPFEMGEMPPDSSKSEWEWAGASANTADSSGDTVETDRDPSQGERQDDEPDETFEDERPDETTEATPDYAEACFKVVEDYLETDENQPAFKKLVTQIITQYSKKPKYSTETLTEDLKTYLEQHVYQQTEVLEANTPELKKVLQESRNWNEKKTRTEVHERKVKKEENEKEKEKIAQQLKYVDDDIRSLQEDIKGLPEGVKPDPEQIQQLMKLRTGEGGQQELRGKLDEIKEKATALDKEINMITHGTRDRLKRGRKATAETMVMHLHGFFIGKEKADIDPIAKMDLAMVRSEKSLRKMKVERGFAGRKLKYRMEASHKEVLEFLSSEKTPLTSLPEKAKKMIPKLKEIGKGDIKGLKIWVNELARQFEASESKEKTKETLVAVISNIQGIVDEKRFFKAGVGMHTAKTLTKLNRSLKSAYREHLSDKAKKELKGGKSKLSKEESMNQLLQEIDDFNLGLSEAREEVATDMPEELKAFLKEHRKNNLSRRAGRGLAKGAWGLTKGLGKGGKFGLGKLWNFTKKHPAGSAKGSAFLAACIALGAWNAASTTFVLWGGWKLSKGLWRRARGGKIAHSPV